MAKGNDVVPSSSGGLDGGIGTIKGVLMMCVVGGVAIWMSYSAGSRTSEKVLRQVNKERNRNEREKRRDQRRRKKERNMELKLEKIKARNRGR